MTPEEQKLVDESFTHMDLESKNLVAERVEQLKVLFPEITVEGDGTIDFDKLRLILGVEVDEGQERYAFTWPGKADAIRQAQTPSTATLRPDEADSVDWDTTENLYIEGDNLEVLKLLQRGYHGKVKMIYIDPPYNTGHDFVYKDSFQDSIENYKEQAGLSEQSNADTSGRYHSDWLSMMYPRLKLARELLSEEGVIFISIDHIEVANLKTICDEVFGVSCYIAHIAWRSSDSSNNNALTFSEDFNDIFVYSKSPYWRPNYLDDPEKRKHYKNPDNDPRGPYFDGGDVSNPGWRPNLQFDIVAPNGNVIKHPANGWRWSKERMDEMFESGELRFSDDGTRVIKRRYLADMKGLPPSTLWENTDKTGHTRSAKYALKSLFPDVPPAALFSTPKPTQLIQYILELAITGEDDIVLDFFAGSGSTAEAVMRFNETSGKHIRYIAVQIPEKLSDNEFDNLFEMSIERIRRYVANNKKDTLFDKENYDNGFRVLKLDSSNFDKVEGGALVDNLIKPGRTHDDIIFEMMLKWGLELSLPMEKTEAAGYPITSIAADELICCMDEGLTVEVLEAIAALEPKRVFFLDSVLTDTIKLNAAQIFKRVGNKLGYEIELRTA